MKAIHVITFFLVFYIIYFFGHYYIGMRLASFFPIIQPVWLFALLISLTFPLGMSVDKFLPSRFSRWLYFAGSLWLGLVFMLFSLLVVIEIISIFIPLFEIYWTGYFLLASVLLVVIISMFNASKICVNEITIPRFGRELIIVQLSDIHLGAIRRKSFLERVIKKTNELKPDIVVVTGDIIDGSDSISHKDLTPFNNLSVPVYCISGNHDIMDGEERFFSLIKRTALKPLRNEVVRCKGIQIIGISYADDKKYISDMLEMIKFSSDGPTILLTHMPSGYRTAREKGVNLQLSGHTHGGQIFPFNLFVHLAFSKVKGLYKRKGFSLYVSSGTGTWGPFMRLGSCNEITVFRLKEK